MCACTRSTAAPLDAAAKPLTFAANSMIRRDDNNQSRTEMSRTAACMQANGEAGGRCTCTSTHTHI